MEEFCFGLKCYYEENFIKQPLKLAYDINVAIHNINFFKLITEAVMDEANRCLSFY